MAGLLLLTGIGAAALFGGVLAPGDPFAAVAVPLQPPSSAHLMGTDDLGRDLLTAVVHGLRTSLVVGVGVAVIAAVIGVAVGSVAGYRPGLVDDLLMRLTELVQVMPRFFLAIVVVALFGPGLLELVVLLGLTSWTWTARVVRAETLSLKERDFVQAARSLGASAFRILLRHLFPNTLGPTVVMVSVAASSAILIEAGLGFVGLTDPETVSLGWLVSNAQRFLRVGWWMAVFPGAAIVLTVVAINLAGDALTDLWTRRLRR